MMLNTCMYVLRDKPRNAFVTSGWETSSSSVWNVNLRFIFSCRAFPVRWLLRAPTWFAPEAVHADGTVLAPPPPPLGVTITAQLRTAWTTFVDLIVKKWGKVCPPELYKPGAAPQFWLSKIEADPTNTGLVPLGRVALSHLSRCRDTATAERGLSVTNAVLGHNRQTMGSDYLIMEKFLSLHSDIVNNGSGVNE